MDETVERLVDLGSKKRGNLVATVDSSGLVMAQDDEELLKIYQNAAHCTPDSQGVVWGLRRKGRTLGRVSGVDLAVRLCSAAERLGWSVYLLGAKPGIADQAAKNLTEAHPDLRIVGVRHGYFDSAEDEKIASEIAESNPDIIFAAMGIPRQEKFLSANSETLNARLMMGVGGTLDVLSGEVSRAPRFFQKIHVEWLWRLILNPTKASKVKLLPKFVKLVRKEGK